MLAMKLTIDRLQKSLNVLLRQHWTKFQKEQEVFDILVHKEYKERYGRLNFKGKRVKVSYTLFFKDRQRRDYSNYSQKMIDDSLVRAGIIDDDNSEVIVEESVRIRYDKGNPRTEVEIFETLLC